MSTPLPTAAPRLRPWWAMTLAALAAGGLGLSLWAGGAWASPEAGAAVAPASASEPRPDEAAPAPWPPAAVIEAARAADARAEARKLPPGEARRGVHRAAPRPLPGEGDAESPAIVADPSGGVWVAWVRRQEARETLYLQRFGEDGEALGAPRALSAGARAWRPALAMGTQGRLWVAWCGRQRAPAPGDHGREIFARWVRPRGLGPIRKISTGAGRDCDPALAVDSAGRPHLAWEHSPAAGGPSQIAWRRLSPAGRPDRPPRVLSQGHLARRPALAAASDGVYLAWDELWGGPSAASPGALDPDYELRFRRWTGAEGWSQPAPLDPGPGIDAAPALAPHPEGGVVAAYHSSRGHPGVKRWRLALLRGGEVFPHGPPAAPAPPLPAGEQQGSERPALALSADRALLLTRPSQGAYLHLVDAAGAAQPHNLTRRGWGARGARASLTVDRAGVAWAARRARHEAVVERFAFAGPGAGLPRFAPTPSPRAGPSPAAPAAPRAPRPAPPLFEGAFGPGAQLVFGDLHMHSAASDGTGTPDEIYARAWTRGLDFAALTDHDYIVGSRMALSEHAELAWVTDVFDSFEGFTTLQAFEWTTPPTPRGHGHRNVYFRAYAPTPVPGFKDGHATTALLNATLRRHRAFTAPHHCAWTGTDWEAFDPSLQRHYELVSVHGAFERPGEARVVSRGEAEGSFAVDGLAQGLRFGFIGGSDAHGLRWHHGVGRREDPWDQGLTGVYVSGPGREALFDALYARRAYASSGAAAGLWFSADGHPPGAEAELSGPPLLRWALAPTRPLSELSLLRDGVVVHTFGGPEIPLEGSWRDEGATPGPHLYYIRVVEGQALPELDMLWSSPVFLTPRPGPSAPPTAREPSKK